MARMIFAKKSFAALIASWLVLCPLGRAFAEAIVAGQASQVVPVNGAAAAGMTQLGGLRLGGPEAGLSPLRLEGPALPSASVPRVNVDAPALSASVSAAAPARQAAEAAARPSTLSAAPAPVAVGQPHASPAAALSQPAAPRASVVSRDREAAAEAAGRQSALLERTLSAVADFGALGRFSASPAARDARAASADLGKLFDNSAPVGRAPALSAQPYPARSMNGLARPGSAADTGKGAAPVESAPRVDWKEKKRQEAAQQEEQRRRAQIREARDVGAVVGGSLGTLLGLLYGMVVTVEHPLASPLILLVTSLLGGGLGAGIGAVFGRFSRTPFLRGLGRSTGGGLAGALVGVMSLGTPLLLTMAGASILGAVAAPLVALPALLLGLDALLEDGHAVHAAAVVYTAAALGTTAGVLGALVGLFFPGYIVPAVAILAAIGGVAGAVSGWKNRNIPWEKLLPSTGSSRSGVPNYLYYGVIGMIVGSAFGQPMLGYIIGVVIGIIVESRL